MPDFRAEVRRRLSPLNLSPEQEAEVAEEMAAHLDDRYEELCASGISWNLAGLRVHYCHG
jgi:hypothetical protein